MKMYTVSILITINIFYCSALNQLKGGQHYTQVMHMDMLEKQKIVQDNYYWNAGVLSFREMIGRSGIIVDKSLLIAQVLHECSPLFQLINAPRRWGKSTNLDMISFFAEIPLNRNESILRNVKTSASYKYFTKGEVSYKRKTIKYDKPPLISQFPEMITKHLGRYAVVKLDFYKINLRTDGELKTTFSAFFETFQEVIRDAYRRNVFILDILRNKIENAENPEELEIYIDTIEKYANKKIDNTSRILDSISLLCEIMKRHSGHEVLLLVDEYDKCFSDIYFDLTLNGDLGSEERRIIRFMIAFFERTYRNMHFTKAVATGIMRIHKAFIFSGINHLSESSIMVENDHFPFYGFVPYEVDDILKITKSPDSYEKLQEMYDGYYSQNNTTPIFNAWDIIKYTENRRLDNYWINTASSSALLNNFLHYYKFKIVFNSLLKNDETPTCFSIPRERIRFTQEDYENIGMLARNARWGVVTDYDVQKIMAFLLMTGYLTVCNKCSPPPNQINGKYLYVKIPNKEVSEHVRDVMKRHYNSTLGKHIYEYFQVMDAFYDFLQNDENTSTIFENSIRLLISHQNITKNFLQELNSTNPNDWMIMGFAHVNEAALHHVVYKVLSFLQVQQKLNLGSEVRFSFKYEYNQTKDPLSFVYVSDIFVYNHNRAAIIELKQDKYKPITEVMTQAETYSLMFRNMTNLEKFDVIKFIAIKYIPDKNCAPTVDIYTTMKTREEIPNMIQTHLKTQIDQQLKKKKKQEKNQTV